MALARINLAKATPEFIETLFKSSFFYDNITRYSTGSTNRKYLTPKQLFEQIEIPDLTIDEQTKFVNKVRTIEESALFTDVKQQELLL